MNRNRRRSRTCIEAQVWEGYLDTFTVETFLDLLHHRVFCHQIIGFDKPHSQQKLNTMISKLFYHKERFRVVKAVRVFLRDFEQQLPDPGEVLFVGNGEVDVKPPNGKFRNIYHLGIYKFFIGYANILIVKGADLDRKEINGENDSRYAVDFNYVTDSKSLFRDEKDAADDV